ncbi:hypothetical protein QBC47DRAFT_441875 [Echria macrotheca]|uniref:Uncharacterized protein n=1 Tax=Echria macrotheca TaxID=438768 RepID=A0AAJ0F0W8_9PEZI|nr:hypothetical protein QBC47DRAFT_441875 [Echria macrotheca]
MGLGTLSVLLALSTLAAAGIQYAQPTEQCSFHATPGTATCCCNGDCESPSGNGTVSIITSKDLHWGMGCAEYETPSYQCCDCPAGFRSTDMDTPNCLTVGAGISSDYNAAAKQGTDGAAIIYSQNLNFACLRSNCTSGSVCQDAAAFRPDECRTLDGDFEFEQTVLNETASEVAAAAAATAAASTALSDGFEHSTIVLGSENPLLSLFIAAAGIKDSPTWGKTYAANSLFGSDLAPQIQGYLHNIVRTTPDTKQLQGKLVQLAEEQNRMLKCALVPSLQIQASKNSNSNNQILSNPSLAGSLQTALGSTAMRMASTHVELSLAKRFESFKASLVPLGITLPLDDRLLWNPRNWVDTSSSLPGLSTNLTELSPAAPAQPLVTLKQQTTSFSIQILDRPSTASPLMARAALLDPASNPALQTPMQWRINASSSLRIVAPVAAIYPALADLVMWNATHVVPGNVSAKPIPFGEFLTHGQEQATTAITKENYVMYSRAKVKMAIGSDVLSKYGGGKDLALYDLVSGTKLDGEFNQQPDGSGEFTADVSAGKGSWDGEWGGGGCFGIATTSAGMHIRVGVGKPVAGLVLVIVIGLF